MPLARTKVAFQAASLEGRARKALRGEASALSRAGEQVALALASGGTEAELTAAGEHYRRLAALRDHEATLRAQLASSLDTDRRDFALASQYARWAVVARGVLDRVAVRDRMRREARERARLELELGKRALDGGDAALRARVPVALADEIARARADAAAATEDRRKLLEPYGGRALPEWLSKSVHELRVFAEFVWDQLSKRFFLRAPAVAGLLVGWWIARTYTDSTVDNVLYAFGVGDRQPISPTSKERLMFWLPLLAAALCSYIGARVAARVQRIYAAPPTSERDAKAN